MAEAKTEKRYCYHCRADRDFHVIASNDEFVARKSSHVVAWGSSHVEAWGSSHVVAWGSSHVEARESSHVVARESSHVVAWGSSHVEAWGSSHVVAWGSSHVEAWGSSHVEARESSHVVARESSHVVAWGSSHVEAWGSSHVVASKFVSCHIHGQNVKIKGGVQIQIPEIATMAEWCDFYGVEIKKGVAVLFKGVDDDFSTESARSKKIFYKPGEQPQAPDWDGGKTECGGGLHFSPTPSHTLSFNGAAKHFIACPVKVADIKIIKHPSYPEKVKAPGLCAPCWEVDRYGKRVD